MISTRYAIPVAILLAIASVPTFIHSYLGLVNDDRVAVKEIVPVLDGFTVFPSKRQAGYGQETFGCQDWVERIYSRGDGKSIRLFIGKGYDHKRLYHHPELALSYAKDLRKDGQIRLPGHPETAINMLSHTTNTNMAAYALMYDGNTIDNPILHQVLDSLKLLVSGRKPMILFYVSDDNLPKDTAFNKSPVALLLTKAIESYQAKLSQSLQYARKN